MSATATIQDLLDEGVKPKAFGDPPDWLSPGGYLDRLLEEAADWVVARSGNTTAPEGAAVGRTRRAEVCYALHLSWRRRASRFDGAGATALAEGADRVLAEYRRQAEHWLQCAEAALAELMGTHAGSGLALQHVETGPWPVHDRQAVTA